MGKLIRWIERRKHDLKRKILAKKYDVEEVPTVLSIALTNRCNADCVYCRREYKTIYQDMNFDFYQKIIEAMPFIEEIQPQINGELLLYPKVVDVVNWAKKHGKRVVIYTNGTLLTQALAASLLRSQLDKIVFSIDECEKERFEKLRRRNVWEKVLYNVESFQSKRDYGEYNTKTAVRICITPENVDRIKEIKSFWADRVDEVVAMPELYMPNNYELEIEENVNGKSINCKLSYDNIAVETNGDLLLCCSDFFNSFSLGNLRDIEPLTPKKILALYNNSEFSKIRESLRNGEGYPYKCHVCQGRSDLILER